MLTYAEIDYLNVEHYFYYVYHHLHITRTKKKKQWTNDVHKSGQISFKCICS